MYLRLWVDGKLKCGGRARLWTRRLVGIWACGQVKADHTVPPGVTTLIYIRVATLKGPNEAE